MSSISPGSVTSTGANERGFTLIELLITMAITTVILGATMMAMNNATSATQTATQIADLNNGLRTAMDLMVRDMLQVGQGLPSGRSILIPNGAQSQVMQLPGPVGSSYTYDGPSFCPPDPPDDIDTVCESIQAVIPGPGRGPQVEVDGNLSPPTDMLTTLAADSTFDTVDLVAFGVDGRSVTVALPCAAAPAACPTATTGRNGKRISDNPDVGLDNIRPGDLIMLVKGSNSALVEVSTVAGQQINFAANDALQLNQTVAADGTALELRNTAPVDQIPNPQTVPPQYMLSSTATRIRMISYYLDVTTDVKHPRLIRRINNGGAWDDFDNANGTVVAFDVENLQFTYDLSDGVTNPANVRMNDFDLTSAGPCTPNPCYPSQIRKINILLSGRSRLPRKGSNQFFRNRLVTQVSLRSMAFVDRYR
jgi:prepilin-type N-terminal cleavage/methylation domain-containing protein